jgi:hypothetical protein
VTRKLLPHAGVLSGLVALVAVVGCSSSPLSKDASGGSGADGSSSQDVAGGQDQSSGGGGEDSAVGGDAGEDRKAEKDAAGRDGAKDDVATKEVRDERDAKPASDGGAFTPPARCALPFEAGPCEAAIRVWASVNGTCTEQIYGGCQGNENRFDTLEECLATCEGRPAARPCPAGRAPAKICLQCGFVGGCGKTAEVCALTCTKHEDCMTAPTPRPSGCFMGVCEAYGCV